jgi:hypothetical protein
MRAVPPSCEAARDGEGGRASEAIEGQRGLGEERGGGRWGGVVETEGQRIRRVQRVISTDTDPTLFFFGEFATNQGENRGERWVSGVYGEGEGEGEGEGVGARAR